MRLKGAYVAVPEISSIHPVCSIRCIGMVEVGDRHSATAHSRGAAEDFALS